MAITATQTTVESAIELPELTQGSGRDAGSTEAEPAQGPDQRLNKSVYLKIISAGFSFFVAGVNDGSIGALIPYIIREYDISTAIVSSVYGANFLGWLFAAFANTHLCQYLNLGAMLALGAVFQIAAHALRSWDPPFGLFVVTFWLVSVGQAFQDTHANSWVASAVPKGAHRWLAFIHAMYMAGCLVGPFVSTAIASAGDVSRWYLFYTFPLALGAVNLGLTCVAFRDTLGLHQKTVATVSRNKEATQLIKKTASTPSVWLLSLFFFFYLGSVLTAGGWVVEYLVNVRHGDLSQMGYVPAGFSGGGLLGRLLLAEPTHRFGERRMVFFYIVAAIGLQLIFWLVPNIIAASIAVSLIGFFTGPLFPTGISLGSKLFSPDIHSTALPLVFVFAQMGGSLFPIITGVVSADAGVRVLQPILVALLATTAVTWMLVPSPKSTSNTALHQE
ncbi:major facilitator superfamily domain-containing protein [Trichoderma breve]|uniref:Major facilitator superfamily domain-containing protein n=1 Tax=Trichoderma breve TaxID=2034170 RepID=A0A9W9E727_9HYPO|nr:major facilitator superfamily domain-containing protein [Trichoderma breve]KAJ4861453.1 major facilitator superfamily domain-containing protein [Trichoderma breve]